MENQKDKYKWSNKLVFLLAGMALTILYGSYLTSVMADKALEIGDSGEAAILALMSMTSLPAAVLSVVVVI